jgi:hypothetical protein
MNVDELRGIVHAQTQTTSGDLADSTIDTFLRQGFERTINAETRWPFYEQYWDLVLAAGEMSMTLPGDVNQAGIMALYDVTNNFRLTMIAAEYGDDHFGGPQVGTLHPVMYSLWGDSVYVWPRVQSSAADRLYRLRGYRRPLSWLTPANEPDCDERLHLPLTHYAVALAYAQQEDDQLELTYMDRWQRDTEMAHRAIMDPRHQRPLVMAGSIDGFVPRGPAWVLVPPTP